MTNAILSFSVLYSLCLFIVLALSFSRGSVPPRGRSTFGGTTVQVLLHMCYPIVLWTLRGNTHILTYKVNDGSQPHTSATRYFLFLFSAPCVSLSLSVSFSLAGQRSPERPVDIRGNSHGMHEILMYNAAPLQFEHPK